MTKKSLIALSIFIVLIVLTGVLFGTVFCLRSQNVKVIGDTPIDISREEIISTAGFNKGESIFMLDKSAATSRIEEKYANIKVIQIKTKSITEVEIRIRARHEMFYTEFNNNFYVMDEELKVLNIIEANPEGEPTNAPINLIYIENDLLNIHKSTLKCDFIGSDNQQKVVYDLCNSMMNVVTKQEAGNEVYFTRTDVKDVLRNIEFQEFDSFEKLVVTTKYGVKLDIENPSKNLENKINVCFSTIEKFILDANDKEKSGTIKIYYDLNGTQSVVYMP